MASIFHNAAERVMLQRADDHIQGMSLEFETILAVMAGARLILICGLPGSGKTTFARELAPKVPAVRLSPDEWKHDLGIDYYD